MTCGSSKSPWSRGLAEEAPGTSNDSTSSSSKRRVSPGCRAISLGWEPVICIQG